MLNFAEQTGSGAVMLVWSFPIQMLFLGSIYNSPISCMYMYMYMYTSFKVPTWMQFHRSNFFPIQAAPSVIHSVSVSFPPTNFAFRIIIIIIVHPSQKIIQVFFILRLIVVFCFVLCSCVTVSSYKFCFQNNNNNNCTSNKSE